MRLKCQVQLSHHPEFANARFVTYGQGETRREECWMVFRDQLAFDESQFTQQPAWGITPDMPTATGPAMMQGEFLRYDDSNPNLVLVRIPTADPSDAWRVMRVPRDDVELQHVTVTM